MAFLNDPSSFRDGPQDLKHADRKPRPRWGWIVALGSLIAGMGVAALILVVSATIASVYTIAIFMILAGAAEIATGLGAKTWGRFLLWILRGTCLYRRRGLCACAAFGRGGLLYFGAWRRNDRDRGGPDLPRDASLCSAARPRASRGRAYGAGRGLILVGWPENSFVILGILLGLDLLFWGAAWIGFGLRLRRF